MNSQKKIFLNFETWDNEVVTLNDLKVFTKAMQIFKYPLNFSGKRAINIKVTAGDESYDYEFKNPLLQEGPFVFAFVGDTQRTRKKDHRRIARLLSREDDLGFVINSGDLVNTGGSSVQWRRYFRDAVYYGEKFPLIAAVGNHEYHKAESKNYLPLKFKKYVEYDNLGYSFYEFKDFSLIILNSNRDRLKREKDQEQQKWLNDKLQQMSEINKKVIISFHHAPFTSSIESGRHNGKNIVRNYIPIFEKYSNVVKLILAGHEHLYERSRKKGITYLTTGPAGGYRQIPMSGNRYRVKRKSLKSTYSLITVEETIKVKTVTSKNRVIDRFEIQ